MVGIVAVSDFIFLVGWRDLKKVELLANVKWGETIKASIFTFNRPTLKIMEFLQVNLYFDTIGDVEFWKKMPSTNSDYFHNNCNDQCIGVELTMTC